MKRNIIIAGGSSGYGHIQAAKNVMDSILHFDNFSKIELINIFDYLPSSTRFVLEDTWEFASKYMKSIYRVVHRVIINNNFVSELLKKRFTKIANNIIPSFGKKEISVFVATHPVAAAIGAGLKSKFDFLFCVAPTDFILHNFYFYPEVDFYYMPPDYEILESISNSKDFYNKLLITGIPVSPNFWVEKKCMEVCKDLGLSRDLFTVFISFGGSGLNGDKYINVFQSLLKMPHPMQFIILSGKNQFLQKKLRSISSKYNGNHEVLIFGFIKNIADLMTAASIYIGKAGGLSLSEALAKGLPIAILETLPGQEDYNARFIVRNKLGVIINNQTDLVKWINTLFLPEVLKEWGNRAKQFGRPFSGREIALHILNSI